MNALFQSIKLQEKSNRFYSRGKSKLLDRSKGTIYVVRLMRNAPPSDSVCRYLLGNARPCNHCQKLLRMYNIRRVKYTDVIDGENVLCELRLV